MTVRFELTTRLAELAGLAEPSLELDTPSSLPEALRALIARIGDAAAPLAPGGSLHPSILVVVDGLAHPPAHRDVTLRPGQTVRLMLPVAGG